MEGLRGYILHGHDPLTLHDFGGCYNEAELFANHNVIVVIYREKLHPEEAYLVTYVVVYN